MKIPSSHTCLNKHLNYLVNTEIRLLSSTWNGDSPLEKIVKLLFELAQRNPKTMSRTTTRSSTGRKITPNEKSSLLLDVPRISVHSFMNVKLPLETMLEPRRR